MKWIEKQTAAIQVPTNSRAAAHVSSQTAVRFASLVLAAFALLILPSACSWLGKPSEQAPAERLGKVPIRISWADHDVAKRLRVYGYNVHRSYKPDADFVQINTDPIVPSPDNPNPPFVVYYDQGLPMGREAYYYIEAVLQDGRKEKVTPVAVQRVEIEMSADEIAQWRREEKKRAQMKTAPSESSASKSSQSGAPSEKSTPKDKK